MCRKIVIFSLENTPAPHTSRLRPFKEILAVVRDSYVKHKNAIYGPDAVINNPDGCMYFTCCALKGLVKVRRHAFFPYLITEVYTA
jgi:hypothetical protein